MAGCSALQNPLGYLCLSLSLSYFITLKLKKKKKKKKLKVIQMIHAIEMQMNFVQRNAIDYCPKVIDQFCISL